MEDLSGKQLGPYRPLSPLGEGGMAAVYKACQSSIKRVILKALTKRREDRGDSAKELACAPNSLRVVARPDEPSNARSVKVEASLTAVQTHAE